MVHLQDAEDVLVGGDLHGHLGNFRALMTRADLARHPRRHLVLQELIHGPFRYADGSNPNGSLRDIAGVMNAAGNVAGLMPHPETAVEAVLGSDDGLGIIRSFVESAAERSHASEPAVVGAR